MNHQLLDRIKARGIHWLTHFTPAENIGSILEHGIVPRSKFTEIGISNPYINDPQRRDGYLNGTCLSIEHPNTLLLNCWEREKGGVWVVLLIDPTVIANDSMPCKLFLSNAASSLRTEINDSYAPTATDFDELFRDHAYERLQKLLHVLGSKQDVSWHSKVELGWGAADTNDPQAEVIVFDVIPPSSIKAIVVRNQRALSRLKEVTPQYVLDQWHGNIEICDALFRAKKRNKKY